MISNTIHFYQVNVYFHSVFPSAPPAEGGALAKDEASSYLVPPLGLSWRSAGFVLCDHNQRLHGVRGGTLGLAACGRSWTAAQEIRQGLGGLGWGNMSAAGCGRIG